MPQGKVKWFDETKGYGFVTPDDGSKDVFVHYSDIQTSGFKSLVENERVDFEVVKTDKGLKAQKVKKIAATQV